MYFVQNSYQGTSNLKHQNFTLHKKMCSYLPRYTISNPEDTSTEPANKVRIFTTFFHLLNHKQKFAYQILCNQWRHSQLQSTLTLCSLNFKAHMNANAKFDAWASTILLEIQNQLLCDFFFHRLKDKQNIVYQTLCNKWWDSQLKAP